MAMTMHSSYVEYRYSVWYRWKSSTYGGLVHNVRGVLYCTTYIYHVEQNGTYATVVRVRSECSQMYSLHTYKLEPRTVRLLFSKNDLKWGHQSEVSMS